MVDQDQRLLRVYPHRAIAKALPAALVDEPACSQLQPTVRLRIADQIREGLTQAFGLRRIHQRVLEEAAGIAQYGGSGSFSRRMAQITRLTSLAVGLAMPSSSRRWRTGP